MIRLPMEPSYAHPIVLFTLSNQSRDVIVLEKVCNPKKLRTNPHDDRILERDE